MRYRLKLTNRPEKHHVLIDLVTGLDYRVHPDVVHLIDLRQVEIYQPTKGDPDPIPLGQSIERAKELDSVRWEGEMKRRAARKAEADAHRENNKALRNKRRRW